MNIGLGDKRRTILLVDADAHARAVLRNALEAAGFSVGEAANHREGERTALRVRPDAVLVDLMLDAGEDGGVLPERLLARGCDIPCFIVSTASEALMGAVGLHEIGVAGVFLKPVDADIVVQTLRSLLTQVRAPTAAPA